MTASRPMRIMYSVVHVLDQATATKLWRRSLATAHTHTYIYVYPTEFDQDLYSRDLYFNQGCFSRHYTVDVCYRHARISRRHESTESRDNQSVSFCVLITCLNTSTDTYMLHHNQMFVYKHRNIHVRFILLTWTLQTWKERAMVKIKDVKTAVQAPYT